MTINEAIETLNFYRGRGVKLGALQYPDTSKSAVDEAIDTLILEVAGELARTKLEFVVDKSSLPREKDEVSESAVEVPVSAMISPKLSNLMTNLKIS